MEEEGVHMMYQIVEAGEAAVETFSRYIRSHRNCHFLQDPAWAEVKTLWKWCGVLAVDEKGELCGAMSLLIRPLPLGLGVAYAPRGPVCDRNDEAVLKVLAQGMQAVARARNCLLTYLDPDEPEYNEYFRGCMKDLGFREKQCDDFGGVQPQSVFRLSLAGRDQETLLTSFSQKTRYNIRLAQRRNVTVKSYSGRNTVPEEALDAFHQLMQTTGARDHFLVRDRAYFEQLLKALGENAVLYLAYLEDIPIAGSLAVFYGDKAWYLYGASANEHRDAMPNYLLQWRMILEALERGCGIYDFRGVPGTGRPDDPLYGLYRFKKGFSGEHTRFTGLFAYYHKPFLGRMFHLCQNIFRKLRRIF